MLLPELSRKNQHGMAPSSTFFKGLYRRITKKRRRKVFVIGFHKTGTTSLARALLRLGYRVCGFINPEKEVHTSEHNSQSLFAVARPLLQEYDAFEDIPWFMFYKELLETYPDGKFILTMRTGESWYKSALKHYGGYDRKSFHWIYDGEGDPVGNKELFIKKYEQHNEEVINYFKSKNKELLIMNLPNDFNWDKLCSFLNCKKPYDAFPHANAVSSRNTISRKLIDVVKDLYYRKEPYM